MSDQTTPAGSNSPVKRPLRVWPGVLLVVARLIGTSAARVYLARHRVSALLKKEIAAIEAEGSS